MKFVGETYSISIDAMDALFVLFECIESTSHAFFRIHNNGPMPQQQQQLVRRNNIHTFALIKSQVLIKSNNNLPRMTIAADLNNKISTKKKQKKTEKTLR